jgi:hypothetical protein
MASPVGDDACTDTTRRPDAEAVGDLDDDELAARLATRKRRRMAVVTPGSGSVADRLVAPTNLSGLRQMAADRGLCSRPVPMRRTDLAWGQTEIHDVRCNATRESKCPGCAKRAQRLRALQCRQGWHRETEPVTVLPPTDQQIADLKLRASFEYARVDAVNRSLWHDVAGIDADIAMLDERIAASGLRGRVTAPPDHTAEIAAAVHAATTPGPGHGLVDADAPQPTLPGMPIPGAGPGSATAGDTPGSIGPIDGWDPGGVHPKPSPPPPPRRVRSTRRRQDTPDLPRRKVVARTIGRTFTSPEGKVFRPSMFVTVTLPSYGRVGVGGVPVDPESYDYRRAAWDAVHFSSLIDRLFQNLRRAEGWRVQYFGAIEPQKRLAPHAHFAVRGAFRREVFRQVIDATYHQVWWPSTATVVYPEHAAAPVWNDIVGGYEDPTTGLPLPTWEQAIDALDAELEADPTRGPEHVVRFGAQSDLQGVIAGTQRSKKLISYLCKYLTKSVAECRPPESQAAADHQQRLFEELRFTPCSPRCPNWLRFGIQPERARREQKAGRCGAAVHSLDSLGVKGRRVLVSRDWSGKTLADHRYDQAAWRRQLIRVTPGLEDEIDEEMWARIDAARNGGAPAPISWEMAKPGDPGVADTARRLLLLIDRHERFKAANIARNSMEGGPPDDVGVSATAGDSP